jgi:hypothetical protein
MSGIKPHLISITESCAFGRRDADVSGEGDLQAAAERHACTAAMTGYGNLRPHPGARWAKFAGLSALALSAANGALASRSAGHRP